ncbi:hypothetical protein E4H12_12810 [Candidatus Thorarchaeota archaeon]|nr:MAG: hypothetical protein E4H12_12810 [Candidatus Thorarchaeota archaeon]
MKLLETIRVRRINKDRDDKYDVERDPKNPAYSYVPGTRDHEIDITDDDRDEDTPDMYSPEDEGYDDRDNKFDVERDIDITNDKPCHFCKQNPCECDRDDDTFDMYGREDEGSSEYEEHSSVPETDCPNCDYGPFRDDQAECPRCGWGYRRGMRPRPDDEEDCETGLGTYGMAGMAMRGGPAGWEEEEDSPCPRCHCNPCRCDEEDQEETRELNFDDETDDTLAGTDPGEETDVDLDLDLGDNEDGLDQEADVELDAVTDNVSEDPDRQGLIRKVKNAHLVFKRKIEDGTFEELWIYNSGNNLRDELEIREAVLAGTDIPAGRTTSPDGKQQYEIWSAGNAEMLQIQGLPN